VKKIYIFASVIATITSVVFVTPVAVLAQYTTYVPTYNTYGTTTYNTPYTGMCTDLPTNLSRGSSDVLTGGQVSALQSFLTSQGYLTLSTSAAKSKSFDESTYQAVGRYQTAHGLPYTGIADVATRASIKAISCGSNNGYNYNYNYNNSYNNYNYNNYSAPILNSLSVSSGAVGMAVTIYGSGFDLSNNTVNFGGIVLTGIPSYQGTALAFTVPQVYNNYNNYNYNYSYSNYDYNNGYNTTGTYSVSVITSHGTSNSLSFTINSGNNYCYGNSYNNGYNNCYNNGSISVSNVTGPTSLTAGTQGVWSLTLYNPNSNYVTVSAKWGDENTYNNYGYTTQQSTQSSYVQGQQTITFTHTYQTSGYYSVVFTATDNTGAQTSVSATVNVSGSTYYNQGQLYLSSISPSSARIGTQVILYGSGFTTYGNTVHFGNGGMMNLVALSSGTMLYFTIPYAVSACDITGSYGVACPTYAQQVTPGTYPVFVSNSYGQSNILYLTVTY
jgi:Putative peptidoglycan binding domain